MRYFSISFIIILPLIFGQFQKTENRKSKQEFLTAASKKIIVFEEIEHSIINLKENEKRIEFEISYFEYKIKFSLNKENESSNLNIDKMYLETDFNFTYDTDLESAINEIKLLKSKINNDIILFLPTTTEEFMTFQLIKYESQTKTFENGKFTIDTHEYDNVSNFYLTNSIKLNLTNKKFEISIGDFKKNGEFRTLKELKIR
jgi:hypothetical protein